MNYDAAQEILADNDTNDKNLRGSVTVDMNSDDYTMTQTESMYSTILLTNRHVLVSSQTGVCLWCGCGCQTAIVSSIWGSLRQGLSLS